MERLEQVQKSITELESCINGIERKLRATLGYISDTGVRHNKLQMLAWITNDLEVIYLFLNDAKSELNYLTKELSDTNGS